MIQFNLYLYAMPAQPLVTAGASEPTSQITFGSHSLPAYQVVQADRNLMSVSFEQVAEAMSALPRMFFEMDGSFVWRGSSADTTAQTSAAQASVSRSTANSTAEGTDSSTDWQVDGMVYDAAGQVARVELKGHCPLEIFWQLLTCIQPADQLLAYSIDHGSYIRVVDLIAAFQA